MNDALTLPDGPDSRRALLEHIVTLSVSMGERGRAGEWPDVIALEAQRAAAISSFFSAPPSAGEAAMIASKLQEILALDAELFTLCELAKQRFASGLADAQTELGQLAQRTYLQVADT